MIKRKSEGNGPVLVNFSEAGEENWIRESNVKRYRHQESLKVQENQLKVQGNQLKVQENQLKVQENQLKVQGNQLKVKENQLKVQENQLKVQENQFKVQGNQWKSNFYLVMTSFQQSRCTNYSGKQISSSTTS